MACQHTSTDVGAVSEQRKESEQLNERTRNSGSFLQLQREEDVKRVAIKS